MGKLSFDQFVSTYYKATHSLRNFFKSSALSLLVIVVILLLLTQMDQALTMMVDLVENPKAKFSLVLGLYLINALALALSHYPIYTYYAANLNQSGNYTKWQVAYPFGIWPLNRLPVFVFRTLKDTNYTPDRWANYLRYSLGILIHGVWIHFILSSFEPNLSYQGIDSFWIRLTCLILLLLPLLAYVRFKERFAYYKEQANHAQKGVHPKLDKLYRILGIGYFAIGTATLLSVLFLLFWGNFSIGGLIALLVCSYLFVANYLLFRLLRTRFTAVQASLKDSNWSAICWFLSRIGFMQASRNYLGMFFIHFLVAAGVVIYSTLGGLFEWELANGIPLLLAFFYLYYYLIATSGKFFFVSRKMANTKTRRFRLVFFAGALLILLIIGTSVFGPETRTHELDLVNPSAPPLTEAQFIDSIISKDTNTQFYIASHGGGLKANVWTLNVVNELQRRTSGKLMEQAVALSGASGGSLGLALYTGLYRSYGKDTQQIQEQIESLSRRNYTSVDLAFTFGLDTYRKVWPLNQNIGIRDRPYYAMRKYQNEIERSPSTTLSALGFRSYWKQTFDKDGYFPSLIMNTAGTQGNRGILWSVKSSEFNAIFPNSENLADLDQGKTLPFYQAVSTTNRFPVFSPAAKIPGYGHYIDAGAIDNSGLLGLMDLYRYLEAQHQLSKEKTTVFIEIINSKSLYTRHLIDRFRKEKGLIHLSINEVETDNLVADLQTGLNLDKIPEYLSDYMKQWDLLDPKLNYVRLFMPHKVSIEEVEASLGGALTDDLIREQLTQYLKLSINQILELAPNHSRGFSPWNYYEPTLSRHLSESSIDYLQAMLQHPEVLAGFDAIDQYSLIPSTTNENP